MTTIKARIKRHPVLAFYALVFAISWGGILLVVGGPGEIPATREQVETLMPFALLALFAGPSVAGLLLTGLVHGRAGFRDLFTRMTRWRVGPRWYARGAGGGRARYGWVLLRAPLGWLVAGRARGAREPIARYCLAATAMTFAGS